MLRFELGVASRSRSGLDGRDWLFLARGAWLFLVLLEAWVFLVKGVWLFLVREAWRTGSMFVRCALMAELFSYRGAGRCMDGKDMCRVCEDMCRACVDMRV